MNQEKTLRRKTKPLHNLKPHADTAWEKQRGRKGNEMKVTVEKVVDMEDRQFEDAPI